MGKLTAVKIRSVTQPGRYSDGGGLFLEIDGKGAASWILRIQTDGKRQDIRLGPTKAISLANARGAAFSLARRLRRESIPSLNGGRCVRSFRPSARHPA
jgi:hypothetical protein